MKFLYFLTAIFSTANLFSFFHYLEEGNRIVLSTKEIVLRQFPNSYNPSLVKFGDGFLMTFRYMPDREKQLWLSDIGVVVLNKNLDPISEPQLLNTRQKFSKTPSQAEDARIFSFRDRLFVIFNDNTDKIWFSQWERRDMYIAELFHDQGKFFLSPPIKLSAENHPFRHVEKNWIPFEWDKTLLLSYSITPHEILYPNLLDGTCYFCHQTTSPVSWNFGTLRGGTPALLVDGEYLAFFHSSSYMESAVSYGWNLYHYFTGAYTFSANPPFELKKISSKPIVADNFYTASYSNKRVIFPGGFAVCDDLIYMAYGKDDFEMWIATIDKRALMDSLVSLPESK
jgi:predicted GH43/DUF377 family glycosyl hydrolase